MDVKQNPIRFNDHWQSQIRFIAREEFIKINEYLQARRFSNTICHPSQKLVVTSTMSEPYGRDVQVSQVAAKEISVQHLISGFLRRRSIWNQWRLEDTWESVDVQRLDEIRRAGQYEWRPLNYRGSRKTVKKAMIKDANIVLFRNIMDWRRSGDVWCQQIVWSGDFENCQRILQLLEENSSNVKLVWETYDLHPQLRRQYVAHHSEHQVIASIAALYYCKKVDISKEVAGTGDGESDKLCAICHEVLSTATKLRCDHIFHYNCIFLWFKRRLSCPLCRDELI